MAISLASLKKGPDDRPPLIMIYGVHGIGKTSFGFNAPNPVFIQAEDGRGALDLSGWQVESFDDIIQALTVLATEEHDFRSLTLDSADRIETLIQQKVIADNPRNEGGKAVVSIEDYGYGKGYVMCLHYWMEILSASNYLRREKGMIVVMVAHSEVKKFEAPESGSYDRYQPKLHKGASALIQEEADIVLFANYRTTVSKEKEGFGRERSRAVGQGERAVFTEERPAWAAKNRYNLPDSIELDKGGKAIWGTLCAAVPYLKKTYGAQPDAANVNTPAASETAA